MICPRCRAENKNDSLKCTNCSLKLKIKCPHCSLLTSIKKGVCIHCNQPLAKLCPECKAANNPKASNCRKCNASFLEVQKIPIPESPKEHIIKTDVEEVRKIELNKYALICVELINIKPLNARITNDAFFKKLLSRFYQIIAKHATLVEEKAIKVDINKIIIKFKQSKSINHSATNAIDTANKIISEIYQLNLNLYHKFRIKLKVKIGITLADDSTQKPFAILERTSANTNEIAINHPIKQLVQDITPFPLIPKQTKEGTFFIIKNPEIEAVKIKPAATIKEAPPVKNKQTEETVEVVEQIEQPKEVEVAEVKEQKIEEKTPIVEEDVYTGTTQSREQVTTLIESIVKEEDTTGKLISISAPEGSGKTFLMLSARQILANEPAIWVISGCNKQNMQPLRFFQSMLKTIFSLPIFNTSIDESKASITQVLQEQIGITDVNVINSLLKVLFPSLEKDSQQLYINQAQSFKAIYALLRAITQNNRIVLVIEDIDNIDKASFECLSYMIHSGLLDNNIKIIITRESHYEIENYFQPGILTPENTFNFYLAKFNQHEINSMIIGFLQNQDIIPKPIKLQLFNNSKGLPIYIEEAMTLIMQTGLIQGDEKNINVLPELETIQLPPTTEEIIKLRIKGLMETNPKAYNVICYAAIMGIKFMPALIGTMSAKDKNEFNHIIQTLLSSGFIVPLDNLNCVFKNRTIYRTILNELSEEAIASHSNILLELLDQQTDSNGAILAELADKIDNKTKAYQYWSQAAQEAIAVGDVYSYSNSLEKLSYIVDNIGIENKEAIQYNICEDYGKFNFKINPDKAIKFLASALSYKESQNDTVKIIELSGYIARSCEITGNYSGAIECVDKALSFTPKEQLPIEHALLNYSKLESLFKIGRVQELINIVNTEVTPILTEATNKKMTIQSVGVEDINYILLDTQLLLSKAYALQGNNKCVELSQKLINEASKLNLNDIIAQSNLVIAFYYSLQKNIKQSNEILIRIQDIIPNTVDKETIAVYWNIINILNNLEMSLLDSVLEDLDSTRALAQNCGDHNADLILQAIKGKVLKEQGNYTEAFELFNQTLQISSENKMATSALLLWYFIAELNLATSDIDSALQIATQALEVSKNSNINNHFFLTKLKNLLGLISMQNKDFETALMHLQENVEITKQYGLLGVELEAFILFGQLLKEIHSQNKKSEILKNANKMFNKAFEIAKTLQNDYQMDQIQKYLQ